MKVLVIGGGIAGPALALALTRAGHDVELFDRVVPPALAPGASWVPADIGGAIMLNENVLRVLKYLGILDEVMAAGTRIFRLEVAHMDGRKFAMYPYHDGDEFFTTAILRSTLARIINKALNSHGVYTKVNRRLVWIEQPTDGSLGVTAFFEDRTTAHGDILVGADGIHSTVRSILFPSVKPMRSRYSGYFAVSPINDMPLPPVFKVMIDRQSGNYAFVLPAGNQMVHWGIFESRPDANVSESWELSGDIAVERLRILAIAERWNLPGTFLDLVWSTTRVVRVNFTSLAPLPTWHSNNCVLIGDAAHGVLPFAGQGAGLSLEDALTLAVFFRYLPRLPPRKAFEFLHELRSGRVAKVAAVSELIGRRSGYSPMTAVIGLTILWMYSFAARAFGLSLFTNNIIRHDCFDAAMDFLAAKGQIYA
ncbi:hypothetical protein HK405_010079 [Cladochytrium tenue]|nr:hypothetical protein HK405_010079 [Cladochytrium tenue]